MTCHSKKDISTLLEDIEKLLTKEAVTATKESVDSLSTMLATTIAERLGPRKIKTKLSMSMIGKPMRQLWFQLHPGNFKKDAKETIDARQRLIFLFGDILEVLLLWLAEQAGHNVKEYQRHVELEGVGGSIDCIIDDCLVDAKSASSTSFHMFKTATVSGEDGQDYLGYHHQIQGYRQALKKENIETKGAAFFVINKSTGELCLYEPDEDFDLPKDVTPRIKLLQEMLKKDEIPPQCYKAKVERKTERLYLCKSCAYCPYKDKCWDIEEVCTKNDTIVPPRYYVKERKKNEERNN